jgi:hypothetical protein
MFFGLCGITINLRLSLLHARNESANCLSGADTSQSPPPSPSNPPTPTSVPYTHPFSSALFALPGRCVWIKRALLANVTSNKNKWRNELKYPNGKGERERKI